LIVIAMLLRSVALTDPPLHINSLPFLQQQHFSIAFLHNTDG
jgi:hypothetical protein